MRAIGGEPTYRTSVPKCLRRWRSEAFRTAEMTPAKGLTRLARLASPIPIRKLFGTLAHSSAAQKAAPADSVIAHDAVVARTGGRQSPSRRETRDPERYPGALRWITRVGRAVQS